MNTNSDITTAFTVPFGTQLPVFTSRESYLAFVAAWKAVYRRLGAEIRVAKLEQRRREIDTPHQQHLAAQLEAAKTALLEHNAASDMTSALVRSAGSYPCWMITPENTGNPKTKSRVIMGAGAIANWLLWLRREGKAQARARPGQ